MKNGKTMWKGLSLRARLFGAMILAVTIALCAFFLIEQTSAAAAGFGSIWFLAILPWALCALICRIADPDQSAKKDLYWTVPSVLVAIVAFGSAIFLQEGVICIIMLAPIWLGMGWAGAFSMRALRRSSRGGNTFQSSLILLPLLAGVIEEQLPVAHDRYTLTREVTIAATPAEIWPFLVANRHIGPTEGRWTISQDLIGLPRPRATRIDREGQGAVRTAYWGDHITFDEIITHWKPGSTLGWRFRFTNTSLRDYTDRHIDPDGRYLKVESGGYAMQRIGPRLTRLILHTNYTAKTNVNGYAALWGELMLGDVQDNVLAVIKGRAEGRRGRTL